MINEETATPANLECSVINDLLHLPAEINLRQEVYDHFDLAYRRAANMAAMHALEVQLFTDKAGEPRCAMNERERDLAIEAELTMDLEAQTAKRERDKALRNLQELKNRFEAVQLVARLIAKGNG